MLSEETVSYRVGNRVVVLTAEVGSYNFKIEIPDISQAKDIRFHPARYDAHVYFRAEDKAVLDSVDVLAGFPVNTQFYIAWVDDEFEESAFHLHLCALRAVEGRSGEYHLQDEEFFDGVSCNSYRICTDQIWSGMAVIAQRKAEGCNKQSEQL